MTDPISFASASPRIGLPFLFVGQAQKEVFVNEALARLDTLVQPAVEGEANTPPATPAEGACWLVGASPTGDWAGEAGAIAAFQSGSWIFADPQPGMWVYDKAAGQYAHFGGAGWTRAAAVAAPTGGTQIDGQARAAIGGLIAALVAAGLLA